MNDIHPTALVETGAELGEGVSIGPYSVIHAGARIGDECRIGSHVTIFGQTSLGRAGRVHAGAVLGDTPQDLAFEDRDSRLSIGERCVLREGVTAHRGTGEGTTTTIGDDCYLMNHAHVGHNSRVGNQSILASQVLLAGHVEIGDGVVFGGAVMVHQFCRVGRLCMLGGGCGVNKDVPPFTMTRSMALSEVVGLNVVGLRRAGFSAEDRILLKRTLRTLYTSGLPLRKSADELQARHPDGPARELADFVLKSQRGVCGFAGS